MNPACGGDDGYCKAAEDIRQTEFPMLKDIVFLDHAGSTPAAKSLLARFVSDLSSTLYSNPHSASISAQNTAARIADIRVRLLSLVDADPADFDLIFVANATAGVKLVADAFRSLPGGFRYVHHEACHTSLVGVREEALQSVCVGNGAVEDWIEGLGPFPSQEMAARNAILFSYSAQSHMDGRRYPKSWASSLRSGVTSLRPSSRVYTLLDAASLGSTSPLGLGDANHAPDFTVLSLHKLFGFPDLGALIVRRDAEHVFASRRYFGGGTVEVVVCNEWEQWHASKQGALHERLEDGTLPFHSIIALDAAMDVHAELFGSLERVARHTLFLTRRLYSRLAELRHANGRPVCVFYSSDPRNPSVEGVGPIVSFNLRTQGGAWVGLAEVEKLAGLRDIHIRTGSLCCPGGTPAALGLEPWELRRNFSAGARCGTENDIVSGKPTGMVRASIGAMSTIGDIDRFVVFVDEFYRDAVPLDTASIQSQANPASLRLQVRSLAVYPIKSCAGFDVPPGAPWEVRPEGLAWDREWCLIHAGSGQSLSQKRYPRMALLKPKIDREAGLLRIAYSQGQAFGKRDICVPLSHNPHLFDTSPVDSNVCGDMVLAQKYLCPEINSFFTEALGVPCALARFPQGGTGRALRRSTAVLQKHQVSRAQRPMADLGQACLTGVPSPPESEFERPQRPRILLSNESPILMVYAPSVDALNRQLKAHGVVPVHEKTFRPNIVLEPRSDTAPSLILSTNSRPRERETNDAYIEDFWQTLTIGVQSFELLGACRRCNMVCVNQDTGEKNGDIYTTLAKVRRFEDGKTYFGVHVRHDGTALVPGTVEAPFPTICVGDIALAS